MAPLVRHAVTELVSPPEQAAPSSAHCSRPSPIPHPAPHTAGRGADDPRKAYRAAVAAGGTPVKVYGGRTDVSSPTTSLPRRHALSCLFSTRSTVSPSHFKTQAVRGPDGVNLVFTNGGDGIADPLCRLVLNVDQLEPTRLFMQGVGMKFFESRSDSVTGRKSVVMGYGRGPRTAASVEIVSPPRGARAATLSQPPCTQPTECSVSDARDLASAREFASAVDDDNESTETRCCPPPRGHTPSQPAPAPAAASSDRRERGGARLAGKSDPVVLGDVFGRFAVSSTDLDASVAKVQQSIRLAKEANVAYGSCVAPCLALSSVPPAPCMTRRERKYTCADVSTHRTARHDWGFGGGGGGCRVLREPFAVPRIGTRIAEVADPTGCAAGSLFDTLELSLGRRVCTPLRSLAWLRVGRYVYALVNTDDFMKEFEQA